jgi:hypothetical protein
MRVFRSPCKRGKHPPLGNISASASKEITQDLKEKEEIKQP